MISRKALLAGVALALALAGCGSKNEGAAAGGANEAAVQQQNQRQPPAGQEGGNGGPGMMNRAPADLIGKVKSIDGNTLTVYKSSFTPGQGGGARRGNGMRRRQSGDGQQPSEGAQPVEQGQPQAPADGQRQQGGGRGGMNFENMFTDETAEITVTDGTKIIKREFVDDKMQETELALADLKADDIVTIDLMDGTQEADTITLGTSGFGGRGGARAPSGGQDQSSPQAQQQ